MIYCGKCGGETDTGFRCVKCGNDCKPSTSPAGYGGKSLAGNIILIDQLVRQQEEILALRGLINGAYDIVELWKAETPSQQEWRTEWMAQARKNGAAPSP